VDNKVLLDLGASINLISLAMLEKIGDLKIKPTKMTLQLADRVTQYPYGLVENVLVKVEKFIFYVNFVMMDMEENEEVPLILGRYFIKTARIINDVNKENLKVRSQDDKVTFNFNFFYDLKNFNAEKKCLKKILK